MKTRNTFVSNSSSSSFVIQYLRPKKMCKTCKQILPSLKTLLEIEERYDDSDGSRLYASTVSKYIRAVEQDLIDQDSYIDDVRAKELKDRITDLQKKLKSNKIKEDDILYFRLRYHTYLIEYVEQLEKAGVVKILETMEY